MDFIKALTPKDTEEVKPGLFIQRTRKGYRQIKPIAWNGKIDMKTQIRNVLSFRTLFTIGLILFIYFGYLHDYNSLKDFHDDIVENPIKFCMGIQQYEQPDIKWQGGFEVNEKDGDTNSISSNP